MRFPFADPANEEAPPLQPQSNQNVAHEAGVANRTTDRDATGFFDWLMALVGSDNERAAFPVHVVNQLMDMFPHVPRDALVEDLVRGNQCLAHFAWQLLDCLLEGRLVDLVLMGRFAN